jgi:TolB-like protein/DNA-binding winged helix-turn-helix (wHTH) protein
MSSPLTVIYEFDRFRLDRGNQRLTRDGMLLVTPGKTLAILLDLLEHRDQVVSNEKLVDSHFPKSTFGEEELTGEVLRLKRIMDDTSKQAPIIRFVLGQGYQFEAEVTEFLGDSLSDHKFGSKREESAPTSYTPSKKSKSPVMGTVAAVLAMALIGFGVWRYMPTHASGSSSDDAFSSSSGGDSGGFTGTPQVAILPFQSLTGQANDEGFNKSLTEAIFAALSKKATVKVVPTTEVQHYLESGVSDPVTAGHQLGAQMIVRGMAQRLAGHILVKVQLLSTEDGSQIWTPKFEGSSEDIVGMSAKIAEKISKGA